jgi:hypothetical protein
LDFWQIQGLKVKNRVLPEFQNFLVSRSIVPEKNAFYAELGIKDTALRHIF